MLKTEKAGFMPAFSEIEIKFFDFSMHQLDFSFLMT